MNQEILSCPHCSSKAKLEIGSKSNGLGEEWYKTYDIICTNKSCISHPDCPKVYEDKEECIKAWNRRVGDGRETDLSVTGNNNDSNNRNGIV